MSIVPTPEYIDRAEQAYYNRKRKVEHKTEQLESNLRQASEKFTERAKIMDQIHKEFQIIAEHEKKVKELYEQLRQSNGDQLKLYTAVLVCVRQIRSAKKKQDKENNILLLANNRKEKTRRKIEYIELYANVLKTNLDLMDTKGSIPVGLSFPEFKDNGGIGQYNIVSLNEKLQTVKYKMANKGPKIKESYSGLSEVQFSPPQFIPPPLPMIRHIPAPSPPPTIPPPTIPPPLYTSGMASPVEDFFVFDSLRPPNDKPPYSFPLIHKSRWNNSNSSNPAPLALVQPCVFLMSMVSMITDEKIPPDQHMMHCLAGLHATDALLKMFYQLALDHLKKWQDKAIRPDKVQKTTENMAYLQAMMNSPVPNLSACIFVWPRKAKMSDRLSNVYRYLEGKPGAKLTNSNNVLTMYSQLLDTYLSNLWPLRNKEILNIIGKMSLDMFPKAFINDINGFMHHVTKTKVNVRYYQALFFPSAMFRSKPRLNVQMVTLAENIYMQGTQLRGFVTQLYAAILQQSIIINGDKFDSKAPMSIPPYELLKQKEQEEVKKCRWTIHDHKVTEHVPFTVKKCADGTPECSKCGRKCATKIVATPQIIQLTEDNLNPDALVVLGYKHCCCQEITQCLKCCITDWILLRGMYLHSKIQEGEEIDSILYDNAFIICQTCNKYYNLNMLSPIVFS